MTLFMINLDCCFRDSEVEIQVLKRGAGVVSFYPFCMGGVASAGNTRRLSFGTTSVAHAQWDGN